MRSIVCVLILPVLALSIGCGGKSTPAAPTFTTASLSGAYTLTTSGVNANGPFTLQAIFSMDGNGKIPAGNTFYDSTTTGEFSNQTLTGLYQVSPDGRLQLEMDTQIVGPVTLNAVLASPEHGQLVRFENAATASGTLDKQDATAFGHTSLAGTFAFSVKGTDQAGNPRASAGVFTADAAGNFLGGVMDTNDNGVLSTNLALQPGLPSEFILLPDLGRGGVQFVTPNEGLIGFSAMVVDNNHLKLAGSFPAMVTGDAYRVTDTNIPTSMAFTMAGKFNGSEAVEGGIVQTDGAGNILDTSVVDLNTGGIIGNSNQTGTYAVTGNRVAMSLNALNLVGYPSSGGMQLLTLDNQRVATGVAYAQAGPFSNTSVSGSYSVGISGGSTKGEVDAVAQLTSMNGGILSGSLIQNEAGTLSSDPSVTATYSADASGRGAGTLVVNGNTHHVEFYTVDSSRVLFIETDSQLVIQGTLLKQSGQ